MTTPFSIDNYYFSSNIATSNGGGILFKPNDNGHPVSLVAPTTGPTTSSISLELPSTTGTNGQFLKTDGSGTMSWGTAGSSNTASRTIINVSTYTIKTTDVHVSVLYSTTGATTLTLPSASTSAEFTVVDEGGNASVNNITINRAGSDTIIGNTSLIINGDYNAVRLYNDSSTKWFIK